MASMADFRSSWAVIIGINGYGNGVPALRSPVNDATDLAKLLGEAPHNYAVTLLTDQAATLAGLKQCFEAELPPQVLADDRVLIYFAGHGFAQDGEDGPTGYLLPQDTDAEDQASFLRMETFRDWLGKLRCRHLLVILDCCFAGTFRWTKETRHIRVPPGTLHRERYERFVRNPAWQAIASAAYNQQALDVIDGKVLGRRRTVGDSTRNSPFAQVLFDGLKGKADLNGDGVIMAYELATFLRDRVSGAADEAGHEQMPSLWSLGKNDSGEFIFLVRGHPLDLPDAPELTAENNPYRGLRIYEESDAGLFFGRGKVVEELAGVVTRQPLTMVLGASGTGKSSLVRAGLLAYPGKRAAADAEAAANAEAKGSVSANPAANAGMASDALLFGKDAAAGGEFHRIIMRPADAPAAPLRGLLTQLSEMGEEAPGTAPSEAASDATPTSALAVLTEWFAAKAQRHLLLVIDQFEELVTLCTVEVRSAVLQFLNALIDQEHETFSATCCRSRSSTYCSPRPSRRHASDSTTSSRLRVVLTLRSDFEPQFHESALRRYLVDGPGEARFLVPPLQHDELREIIEKPASQRVLFFEPPALVNRLITEVIQMPGALPLLSFALSELYLKYVARQTAQQRGETIDRAITEDDYRKLRGVIGALSKRATEEYDACDEAHRRTLRRVMLRMVATEGELARRRVPRSELDYPSAEETERANAVVERLEKARLLVSGRTDSGDAADGDGRYVEPAHDALVRSWGKLLDWQREAAAELPLQRQLTEAADEWAWRNQVSGLLRASDPRLPLVSDRTDSTDHGDGRYVESAHDALVRAWGKLKEWRREAAAKLPVVRQLTEAAAEWAWRNQVSGLLWTSDPRLPLVRQQLTANDSWLNKREADFVEASAKRKRRNAIVRWSITSAVLVGSIAFSIGLWRQRNEAVAARDQAVRNESRALAALSDTAFNNGRYDDAVKLALAAWPRSADDARPMLQSTIGSLGKVYLAPRQLIPPLRHEAGIMSATLNHDESIILTWSLDNVARLWDVGTGKLVVEPMRQRRLPGVQIGTGQGALLSPDESRILTVPAEGPAWLWDAANGQYIATLDHGNSVHAEFSPDGSRILTRSGETVRLWDGVTGQPIANPLQKVSDAVFSRDGIRILTWSEDTTVRLWSAATGEPTVEPMHHQSAVRLAVFSLDESRILAWSDDAAQLWDVATGQPLGKTIRHEGPLSHAVFNRDGSRVLIISSNTAQVWNSFIGKPQGKPMQHDGEVNGGAFSRDGRRVLTWSEDKMARLWDAASGSRVAEPMRSETAVRRAMFSPDDNRIVTVSSDRTADLWDAPSGQHIATMKFGDYGTSRHVRTLTLGWPIEVEGEHFNRDGSRILSWSGDNTVRLWDGATGQPISNPLQHDRSVRGAVFDREGTRVLTWSGDGTARLWDEGVGQPATEPMRHKGAINGAHFNHDESLVLTWSQDGTAQLWNSVTGKPVCKALAHGGDVLGATFNRDESLILTWSKNDLARSGGGNSAQLWDAGNCQSIGDRMRHGDAVQRAVFNPSEHLVLTWSLDTTARLWEATTGRTVGEAMKHGDAVWWAVFNHDGGRILTYSGDGIRLWDGANGQLIKYLMKREDSTLRASFDPDGKHILIWSLDGTARLLDAITGQSVGDTMRHGGAVLGAAFKHNDGRILTWSKDSAQLWDAATGKPASEPMRHAGTLLGAALDPTESRILTWSKDGLMRVWDGATGQPIGEPFRHEKAITWATFTGNGNRIATSSESRIWLWNATTGRLQGVIPDDRGTPRTPPVLNNDGSRFLVRIDDNTIGLRDAATGQIIAEPMRHAGQVWWMGFNQVKSRVITGSADGMARIWDVSSFMSGHLFELACRRWQDHDLTALVSTYGIKISDPICEESPPAPDWSKLE